MLQPAYAVVHYQATELFMDMSRLCEDICSEVVIEAMIHSDVTKRVQALQTFSILWRLTGELGGDYKPFIHSLFLMLDSLNDEQPMVR
jgi:hypothetical protein